MGKAAIIAVIATISLSAYVNFQRQNTSVAGAKEIAGHQYEELARTSAMTGIEEAKQLLTSDFKGYSFSGTHSSLDYDVKVELVSTSQARVLSAVEKPDGETYYVQALFERTTAFKIEDEAPLFMQYAVLAEDDLAIKGNIEGDVWVDDEDKSLNANMHTNSNLDVDGNAAHIRGFGTAVTGILGKHAGNAFNPYSKENKEQEDVSLVERIDLPILDVSDIASKLGASRTDAGDVTISGTSDLPSGIAMSTRRDPFIWHVQGNLSITGNTTIDGYVLFLVEQSAKVSGDVLIGENGYDGPDESSTAFYVEQDLTLSGNTELYGQVFTGSGFEFAAGGTPQLYGSVTSNGAVSFHGTANIYYREASPALTKQWGDTITRIELVSVNEYAN